MEKLIKYLNKEKIKFSADGLTININGETFRFSPPVNGKHFDENFELVHNDLGYDNIIVFMGGRYYYLPSESKDKFELKELKYIGDVDEDEQTNSFLGVHGGFELLKGSRSYKDWCAKAKFLGISTLGICEKNTLAGTLKFQLECLKNDITPIIGASYEISRGELRYEVKLYVKNSQGWKNILELNHLCNVEDGKIDESKMIPLLEGLVMVIDPKTIDFDDIFPLDLSEDVYFQMDTVKYIDSEHDINYLNNLKKFVNSECKPVSITDAYYLDEEDKWVVDNLEVMRKEFEYRATNQYFKSKEDFLLELEELVEDVDNLYGLYMEAVGNEQSIVDMCLFKIDTSKRHLPDYVMTPSESLEYSDNKEMFWALVEEGLGKLYPDYNDEHINRIEKEVAVLELGNVIDYFLSTRDIINAATEHGTLTGLARGSAGGSIVSYLLGIIKIDPLKFGLIFERFLNEGRVTQSLPDIDSDFEGAERPWVKAYIEKRFGEEHVCSVGTYTTMKLKGAIKDLHRQYSSDFQEANIVTSCIDVGDSTMTDLFRRASSEKKLKNFILKYPEVFYRLPKVLNQPKARSIHACAMIIFPQDKHMKYYTPLHMHDGIILSEYEGGELDSAGFLKQDILGVKQLDKFKQILKRIKDNGKSVPDIYNLPLDDEEVFRYFGNGWNSDVFQFGTVGLTGYSRKLKPTTIDDLIACVALYRPGPMENGFHESYIKRKQGEEAVSYPWGTDDILSTTYGLMCYQEQIMRICTDVAGFTLANADNIRSALGKKIMEKLVSYKAEFVEGSLKSGCPEDEALNMWEAMLEFAKYSFNLSHSAAYAMTGYIGQWLKVHYPLEYWATAFSYAEDDDIPRYLSEIRRAGIIKIMPPEVNMSGSEMMSNSTDTVYWGLASVKGLGKITKDNPEGGKAVVQVIEERNKNGEYLSFNDFLERHTFKGSKVNKRAYEGLIMAGAFDELEGISIPQQRINILNFYWEKNKVKIDENKHWKCKNSDTLHEEWVWLLEQKRLSGFAFLNYTQLCLENIDNCNFISNDRMKTPITGMKGCLGGVVQEAFERKSSRGKYAKLIIESNYELHNVMIWTEEYEDLGYTAEEMVGCVMLISGDIKFEERYSQANQIVASKKGTIKILKSK